MPSTYRIQLEEYLKTLHLGEMGRVLDVGGIDMPIMPRLGSAEYKEYKILDIDEKADYKWDLNNETYMKDIFGNEKQWDTIFCLEVFEYIYNPVLAIENLINWTKYGGNIYITFPFQYPKHNPIAIDYLRYTDTWIKKIFQEVYMCREVEIIPRPATFGKDMLRGYWSMERLHPAKNTETVYDMGYIVRVKV